MEQITLKKRDWSDSVVGKNVRLLKRGGSGGFSRGAGVIWSQRTLISA